MPKTNEQINIFEPVYTQEEFQLPTRKKEEIQKLSIEPLGPGTIEEDIQQQKIQFAKRSEKYIQQTIDQWADKKEEETGDRPPEIFLNSIDQIMQIMKTENNGKPNFDLFKIRYPGKASTLELIGGQEYYNDFMGFLKKKNSKRYKKLTPKEKQIEIEFGGIWEGVKGGKIYAEKGVFGEVQDVMQTFTKGALDNYTFGLTKKEFEDFLYEQEFNKRSSAYNWGQTFGEIMSFMTLSAFAQTLKVPYYLKKAGDSSKAINYALKAFGQPAFQANKLGVMKWATAEAAGAHLITSGFVGSLMDGIKATTDKFVRQDNELSKSQWQKSIPWHMTEGFFKKYFIGVINAPQGAKAWPWRFVGDAMYSMAEQQYRVATGRQDKIDFESYLRSMITAHVLGEVQGVVFSPSRKQMNAAYAKTRSMYYGDQIAKRSGYPLNDTEKFMNGNPIYLAELKNQKPFSKKELQRQYDAVTAVLAAGDSSGFATLRTLSEGKKIYKTKTIPNYEKKINAEVDSKLRQLSEKFDLNAEQRDFLKKSRMLEGDIKDVKSKLKEWDKLTKEVRVPKKVEEKIPIGKEKRLKFLFKKFKEQERNIGTSTKEKYLEEADKHLKSVAGEKANIDKILFAMQNRLDALEAGDRQPPIYRPASPAPPKGAEETIIRLNDTVQKIGIKNLYSFARTKIKDRSMADDAVHNVILRLTENAKKNPTKVNNLLSKPKKFESYLYKSIQNSARDLMRKEKRADIESLNAKISIRSAGESGEKIDFVSDQRYLPENKIKRSHALYSVLRYYNGQGRENIYHSIAWYMKNITGESREFIAESFNDAGVRYRGKEVTMNMVKGWLEKISSSLNNVALYGKISKEIPGEVRKKERYTPSEVNRILKSVQVRSERLNPITGISKQIEGDSFLTDKVENNGMYMIILKDYYNLAERFDRNVAKDFLVKAGDVIKREVADENGLRLPQKDEGKIFVKNPEIYNSTRFIIYNRGLSDETFKGSVSRITKALSRGFDDVKDFQKRFAIFVKDTGKEKGGYVISDFKNTDVIYSKNIRDIETPSSELVEKRATLVENTPEEDVSAYNLDSKKEAEIKKSTLNPESEKIFLDIATKFGVDNNIIKDFMAGIGKTVGETKDGFLRVFKSINRHLDEATTIFEGADYKEKNIRVIQTINEWSAKLSGEAGHTAANAVVKAHGEILYGLSKNTQNAFVKMEQWIREREYQTLKNATAADLKRPIKAEDTLGVLNDQKLMTPEKLSSLWKYGDKIKDDLLLSKILVQKYGINANELIGTMRTLEEKIYKPLETLFQENQGCYSANYMLLAKIKGNLEAEIKQIMRQAVSPESGRQAKRRFFQKIHRLDITNNQEVDRIISALPKETRDKIKNILYTYERIDNGKLSYTHHVVLKEPGNGKKLVGQIKRYIEGKTQRGTTLAQPTMDEMIGRKIATLKDLVDAGYKIGEDSIKNMTASLQYAYEKAGNMAIAKQFKESYISELIAARQEAIAAGDAKVLNAFFANTAGYFYIPTNQEMNRIDKKISNLEEQRTAIRNRGITSGEDIRNLIDRVETKIVQLQQQKNAAKNILKIYQDRDNRLKNLANYDHAAMLRNIVAEDDIFIPMNKSSHTGTDRSGMGIVFSRIEDGIGKIKAPNLENWDGLYFSRVFHKAFRNLIFRNDYLNKNYEYEYQTQFMKVYDRANRFLKLINFYKPTIIATYDLVQAGIVDPRFAKYLPEGFKAVKNKFKKENLDKLEKAVNENRKEDVFDLMNKNPHLIYFIANRQNLYNRAVVFDDLYSSSLKASVEVMNRSKWVGAMADRVAGENNFIKKGVASGKFFWRSWNEVTWFLDEAIRTMVFRSQFERFYRVHDFKKAAYLAGEQTNAFLVQYSRMPMHTRQLLNRVILVPTYRFQELRMYKEMIKNAGKGIMRAFGGRPEQMYKVSENRFRQTMWELGPALRKIIATAAIRGIMDQWFGYNAEGFFDNVFGYRLKKKKGSGLLDTEISFLSMSTPLFAIEKWITRGMRAPEVLLKYNMAAFPGLLFSIINNRGLIDGRRIIRVNPKEEPKKALGQLGAYMLGTYLPVYKDIHQWHESDVALAKKIINIFGIGFFYKYESPQDIIRNMEIAASKASTPKEREAAMKKFSYQFRRAYEVLFNEQYKEIAEQLEEMRRQHKL